MPYGRVWMNADVDRAKKNWLLTKKTVDVWIPAEFVNELMRA